MTGDAVVYVWRTPLATLSAHDGDLQIVGDVVDERRAQDERWGEQNHPDVTGTWLDDAVADATRLTAWMHHLPTADIARAACQRSAEDGSVTWADIAVEELAEAVEAAARRDTPALRAELVQTAAVLVAWIAAIDRRPTPPTGDLTVVQGNDSEVSA